jgi:hypothetical protein
MVFIGMMGFVIPNVCLSSEGNAFLAQFSRNSGPVKSRFPILDSGMAANTFGSVNPQFYWINNDELLFLAIRTSPDSSFPRKARYAFSVSRWHTQTGSITTVREFGEIAPRLCFSEGHVLFSFRKKDDTLEGYQGRLGLEQPINPRRAYNNQFCQPMESTPALPKWTEGREIRLLEKMGAGFIDFGDTQKWLENTTVRLYKYGESALGGIQLPLGRREIKKHLPYYHFKEGFFVESDYYVETRPKDIPYPVYWLHLDGHVEKIADIPWGPWRSRSSFFVSPSKIGLLMGSHNFVNEIDLGAAGIYLLRAGKVEKILTGWIQELVVSPDGCKVAFTFAPAVRLKNNVLKAINLCIGE